MSARKRKSPNPDGRPRSGEADMGMSFRLSSNLDAKVRAAARAEGVDLTEWWHRAARARIDYVAEVRDALRAAAE